MFTGFASLLLLAMGLAVATAVLPPTNLQRMQSRFDGWKKCHPGYKGFTDEQLALFKKCDDLNIKDHNCYLSCIRYETGLIGKDGKWDDEVAQKAMKTMWEDTPEAQADGQKWYTDTHNCIIEFEKTHTWPRDYSKKCDEVDLVRTCVQKTRTCV